MADAIRLRSALQSMGSQIDVTGNQNKFTDHWDWQAIPITRSDISSIAYALAKKIDYIDWELADDSVQVVLDDLAAKIDIANQRIVPNLFSGPQSSQALTNLLYLVESRIAVLIPDEVVRSNLDIPLEFRRAVTTATRRLESATLKIDGIEEKVTSIQNAHDAAQKLPITMDELDEAIKAIEKTRQSAARYEAASKTDSESVSETKRQLDELTSKANETMDRVEAAYRSSTSEGLAKAFKNKAKELNATIYVWLFFLLVGLTTALAIGASRFPAIIAAATISSNGSPKWGLLLIHVTVSVLTMAAPIWLCWVATKQVGQRFRLAEDYAYKAALATAYEGYRTEAVSIDPMFQAQLFSTALTRLDEIPLRLVERDVHGSPFHELIRSNEFKAATEAFPTLKEKAIGLLQRKNVRANSDMEQSSAAANE